MCFIKLSTICAKTASDVQSTGDNGPSYYIATFALESTPHRIHDLPSLTSTSTSCTMSTMNILRSVFCIPNSMRNAAKRLYIALLRMHS